MFETSSELSVQSKSPSHRKREEIHSPLAQMKFLELHVTGSRWRKEKKTMMDSEFGLLLLQAVAHESAFGRSKTNKQTNVFLDCFEQKDTFKLSMPEKLEK